MKKWLRQHKEEQHLLNQYIREYDRIDLKIIFTVIMLCGFGVIMIYSASSYRCSITAKFGYDSFYFAKRQMVYAGIGIIVATIIGKAINYNKFRSYTKLLYVLGFVTIFLLLTPLGVDENGAVRWINIGINIQVAEVIKIVVIAFLAGLSYKYAFRMRKLKTLIMLWAVGGIPAILLVVISNDLSSALIVVGITFGITFIVTAWKKLHITLLLLGSSGIVGLYVYLSNHMPSAEAISGQSFRLGRIVAWINPELFADGIGYQPLQALYAVASGGLFGKGLGNGVQKLSSIPEAQNDMIFAIICEELGIFGGGLVLFLLGYLIYQLVRIAVSCKDLFGAVIVSGIALHLALQTIINIGVVIELLPNTGASLPFISYGGTAVAFTLLEISMALSVYRQCLLSEIHKKYVTQDDAPKRNRKRMLL